MPYQFSDALDDPLLYERIESFGGGMDGFQRATLLPLDVCQYLENMLVMDNLEAWTRPGADTLDAAPDAGNALQGLAYFDTPTVEQLIAGAGAKLWAWEGSAWAELAGWTPSSAADRLEFAQGVDLLLISDGVGTMRTWDGTNFSASLGSTAGTTTSDPPVGATILCWHTSRMFAAGDAANSDSLWASYLLEFGQAKWNHVDFKLRIGGGDGDPIRALASLQDFWLAVLKEDSVWLVNADPTKTTAADWTAQKLAAGVGCVGRHAWAPSGNDVLFMSSDGVRSLRRMQNAAGQYDVSPPLSQPVQPYIDRINWTYGALIEARAYKHLVFFAVPLDSAVTNSHVLVWNARLARWVGVWTNWTPACWAVTRFGGVQRLVLGETTGLVRQWKDFADDTDDATYTEDGADIPCKVWTRALLFGEPVNDKDGYHAEARFSGTSAIVTITAMGDGAVLRSWDADVRQTGVSLPVNLPFDLFNPAAVTARRGLRGMTAFNELYFKLESVSGWWKLKNVTASAYLNMLQNQ